jgi:TolB-like protein
VDGPNGASLAGDPAVEKTAKKKKRKARSAWISFTGRIIAQIVGAAATIFLGVYAVDKYSGRPRAAAVDGVKPTASQTEKAPARRHSTSGDAAIAVLPLQNFSGDAKQDYLADGLTEALIADLAQVRNLRVISRTSSMRYKGERKTLPEIAEELGVDWIVEGSVVRAAGRIRVTAQLIDAKRDEHVWARSYEHAVKDVLALLSSVAAAIAGDVGGVVAMEQAQLPARGPIDPAVYDPSPRGGHTEPARKTLRPDARFADVVSRSKARESAGATPAH